VGGIASRRRDQMSRKPLFALFLVATVSLACSVFLGGPDLPTPQPISPVDSLRSLEQQLEQAAVDSLSTGTLTLTLTQEQLTAYLAARLSTHEPPLLTDPSVVLRDQKMFLYGRATSGLIEANVTLTTEFGIDAAGLPEIRIVDARLGPLPMPQALQDLLAAAIDEALTGSIGPAAIGFRLEAIEITNGALTVTGRVR
jgi:hypothetical protein